ncbi:uncharacterized protein N7503_006966 [Penicillium pulvis]|uniref:uncharacterized protein n=1 Tax=Penicillium pulvis TaxID=1562058 RepID=UPI002549954A|nr:uncharacterized protein N7503_006966 [Penicillium pulvis]KAJ5797670.1 hypothetical protein N7503_006966 [Penicillium pulvis]
MPPQPGSTDECYHRVSAEEMLKFLKNNALRYMVGHWQASKDLSPAQFVREFKLFKQGFEILQNMITTIRDNPEIILPEVNEDPPPPYDEATTP